MAPLGPFGPGRKLMAAVSGGADSMALALLLRRWGDPVAVVVDHGLRPESAAEAAQTVSRLKALGIPAHQISLAGMLLPGPDIGARARAARYAALLAACGREGLPDLATGHHAQDQAETAMLRMEGGSGPDGLAGMSAVAWRGEARILRPLLPIMPARLRATLTEAGIGWVEDPSNHDPATARGRLRSAVIPVASLVHEATAAGRRRRAHEAALAEELAHNVALLPTGHAEILGPLSEPAWSALLWTLSGRVYPPPREAVRRLAAACATGAAATLHGVQVRRGLAMREAAAMAGPAPAIAGATWDGRFRLMQAVPGAELGPLGNDATRLRRRTGLPFDVVRTLPALRIGGKLLSVPHLAYLAAPTWHSVQVDFWPTRPLAGLPFGCA
jgi:tRNA(Ile)-lysidine synthase